MKTHIPQNNPGNPAKKIIVTAMTALALGLPISSLLAQDQGSSTNSTTNTPGGGGEHRPPGGLRLLPPHAAEILKLTDEQKQQFKDLQAEIKTKIESILTPAQLEQLKQMRPPHPPGGGGPQGSGPQGGAPEGGNQSQSTNQPAS